MDGVPVVNGASSSDPTSAVPPGQRLMAGFPPAPSGQVTLANWQDPPFSSWAFRHTREVIPTHRIPGAGPAAIPVQPADRPGLTAAGSPVGSVTLTRLDGTAATLDDVLASTHTDAFVLLHDGRLVEERYGEGMAPHTPHLVMSVSKSLVSCVTAILAERGLLDPQDLVSRFVPEIGGSGYAGATLRHLLDMRTGVAFREAYTEPDAEVRVMERSMGWRPLTAGDPVGVYGYLATVRPDRPHGGGFTYRSADTDLLGWVCERAAGVRMADLISELVWRPIGAEFDAELTCDPVGTAVHDGGVCATARDLARFGQMLLDGGLVGAGTAAERRVVPASWLADAREGAPDSREAFATSDHAATMPGAWYRNKFWFIPGSNGTVLMCLGIHGQMVYVDFATRTVAVKLSCWPDALDSAHLIDAIRAFGAVGAQLAGVPGMPR